MKFLWYHLGYGTSWRMYENNTVLYLLAVAIGDSWSRLMKNTSISKNSWIVKYVFKSPYYELTKAWRFNDSRLLRDAHAASNGEATNFSGYKSVEHPLALCYTNDAVNAINKKWNDYVAQHTKKKVTGHDRIKVQVYVGSMLMAYNHINTMCLRIHRNRNIIYRKWVHTWR